MIRALLKPFYEIIIILLLVAVILLTGSVVYKNFRLDQMTDALNAERAKEVKLIVDTVGIANAVSEKITRDTVTREIIYKEASDGISHIIEKDTVFVNVCANAEGVKAYNDYINDKRLQDEN